MKSVEWFASWRAWVGAIAGFALFPFAAHAAPIIVLGTYDLKPNQANQTIDVYVSGGDAVSGVNFELTVQDGGQGSAVPGPVIQSVNLFAPGAVFANNNTGPAGGASGHGGPAQANGQFYEVTTTTESGTVNLGTSTSNVLLATVTIDTTGITSGSYSISMNGTMGNIPIFYTEPSSFPPDTVALFTDGVLVVPEPASLGLLGLGLPVLLLRRRRRI